jgi:hypothetical protein
MAAILILLALAKVVYVGIILLLLIIPQNKFKSKWHYGLSLFSLSILVCIVCIAWSNTVMWLYVQYDNYDRNFRDLGSGLSFCGNYQAQKQYILSHGTYFLEVIYTSLFRHPHTYLSGFIGYFGNSDLFLPTWMYIISYLVIFYVAIAEKKVFQLNLFQKVILFLGAMGSFVLLLLSQHLIWDCVGEGIVDLVQGRYLIPLFPLIFLLFPSVRIKLFNPVVVIGLFIVFINVYSAVVINQRYFVGYDYTITELHCDTEANNGAGLFITNQKDMLLEGAHSLSVEQHRSGNSSLRLSPESPFGFNFKLNTLKTGDVLEVEAWQKGEGARFVFSGGKVGCKDFYTSPVYESYQKNGWRRIKGVFVVDLKCENLNANFYVWYPGSSEVFVDDLKLIHKSLKNR